MRQDLIEKLLEYTQEEQELLQNKPLDYANYTHSPGAVLYMDPGVLIPDGSNFGVRKHTRFVDFPRHRHNYVEMLYQVQGETRHLINGTTDLTLEPGHLLIMSRGAEHAVSAAQQDCVAMNFLLIPAFFDALAIRMDPYSALAEMLKRNIARRDQEISWMVYDLRESQIADNLLENLILGQLQGVSMALQQMTLELLLHHLAAMSRRIELEGRQAQDQALVSLVIHRMENQARVNLNKLAEEFHVDVTHLGRAIQQYTGCTFTELMQVTRLNRVIAMLRDTDLSISDIATAVGYETTAFFYRSFKQHYHCTPGAYRKRLRERDGKGDKTQWI